MFFYRDEYVEFGMFKGVRSKNDLFCTRHVLYFAVPNEPKRVQVKAVNSTTIHVEWRPPRTKERNGIIRGYYVYYAKVNNDGDVIEGTERMEDTNDMNKNEIVITNLQPDTKYQVSVAAYTRRGDGLRSRPRLVNTKGAGWLKTC